MTDFPLDTKSQNDLWKHMRSQCVIRLVTNEQYHERARLLEALKDEVETGRYAPRAIHGFLSTPKSAGVPRFVPVMQFEDVAVYFACVRCLDEKLASQAVADTYGGWSLGGKRRESEEQHAKATFDNAAPDLTVGGKRAWADLEGYEGISVPVSTYNRWAWVTNWQQYWKLLAAKFEHAPATHQFAMFDIANFYDSIDLPRLERSVRQHCPEQTFATEVLFFLLSTWNRRQNQYARTTKGLPMDIIGDCSRAMANFYLTPCDAAMRAESRRLDASFMRFADDMVLVCPSRDVCEELIFFVARKLHRLGLNVNVAKVKYMNKEEFESWWGFPIMDSFEVADQLLAGLEALRARWDDKRFGRKDTVLKRAITLLAKQPTLTEWRRWVHETALFSPSIVLQLNDRQMTSLLTIADDLKDGIQRVSAIVLSARFTQTTASLLRCMEGFRRNRNAGVKAAAESVIGEIAKIDDPVLALAVQCLPAA